MTRSAGSANKTYTGGRTIFPDFSMAGFIISARTGRFKWWEGFSTFLWVRSGAFVFIGNSDAHNAGTMPLHNAHDDINHRILPLAT